MQSAKTLIRLYLRLPWSHKYYCLTLAHIRMAPRDVSDQPVENALSLATHKVPFVVSLTGKSG